MNALYRELKKQVALAEKAESGRDPWRLGFHLMPPVGWMNDPNGLCCYKGEYHVFFQYSPLEPEGGLKYWGHYKSKDLLEWEYIGTALYPDQPFDCHGVYSGSALIEDDGMHLFYTGNVKHSGDYDYVRRGRGSNTVHVFSQDGTHFEGKECLMTNDDYPEDCTCHVRDPKVWKEGNLYYMVQGARRGDDVGEILVFTSKDLHHWKLANRITTDQPFGYMWECPDYFTLDGAQILIACPQGVERQGNRYQNLYQNGYFLLQGDLTGAYQLSAYTEMDYGPDFYAPQTFQDEMGRRILIAWAGMPDVEYFNPTAQRGWQHCMTVPRVLHFEKGHLYQNPVSELQKLRGERRDYTLQEPCTIPDLHMYEVYFECRTGDEPAWAHNQAFDLRIQNERGSENESLSIRYLPQDRLLELSFFGSMGAGRERRVIELEKFSNIRILADTSILELYINDGEKVMTTRYYPKTETTELNIRKADGQLSIWKLSGKQE